MKRIFRLTGYLLLFLVGLPTAFLLLSQAWYYASTPVYSFREPQPFTGDSLYNPYAHTTEGAWRKSIFHMHTKDWMGLTSGDSDWHEVMSVYRDALGYEVTAVSNYMSVDKHDVSAPGYIPCYEHGYGYGKSHQLAMGSHGRILWRDYLFVQDLHQKQYVIDLLRSRCEILAINHPDLRYGYTPDDFKYLCGYDVLEALNGARKSIDYWDSALSHGHTAWLTANDDSHGVVDLTDVQRDVIFIYSPTAHRNDILHNLRHGCAFGVSFPKMVAPTLEQKREAAAQVTLPDYITVEHDTLKVAWGEVMNTIAFIGDGGQVLSTADHTSTAVYAVQPTDTYVRTVLTSPTGLVYYLNPIVRSIDGNEPLKQQLSSIDTTRTLFKRCFIGLPLLLVIIGSIWIYKKRKRKST